MIGNSMKNIKLIVGLSNPGLEYVNTRHNTGSLFVDTLAHKCGKTFKKKFFGRITSINISCLQVLLLIPNTYMNLSGKSVLDASRFYKINTEEILVAHDELSLMPGIAKIKIGGGINGHNGLQNIQKKLNNFNFYRLRFGIGHPGDKKKVSEFVLSKPNKLEQQLITNAIDRAISCLYILYEKGFNESIKFLHSFRYCPSPTRLKYYGI